MSGEAHDYNIEMRAVIKFPLKGKALKKIHAILTETLGKYSPWYATGKKLSGPV
jgi:hypothetical protein